MDRTGAMPDLDPRAATLFFPGWNGGAPGVHPCGPWGGAIPFGEKPPPRKCAVICRYGALNDLEKLR